MNTNLKQFINELKNENKKVGNVIEKLFTGIIGPDIEEDVRIEVTSIGNGYDIRFLKEDSIMDYEVEIADKWVNNNVGNDIKVTTDVDKIKIEFLLINEDNMTHAEKSLERVKDVLNSDLTAYRIAKEVGYPSANMVHKFRDGTSDINSLKLSTAIEFERLYEKIKSEGN